MSTHVFPLAGGVDPECALCGKSRSQIERESCAEGEQLHARMTPSFRSTVEREAYERELARQKRVTKRVEAIVATIKTQLTGAHLAVVDDRMLAAGYGERALVYGAELHYALEAVARNILQVIDLEEELSCPA